MADTVVVPGFRWAGFEAGIRKHPGRKDLALLVADEAATCAGIFTKSDMAAAPVLVSRPKAASGIARAVLMNAGCANACTGTAGHEAAQRMAAVFESQGISAAETLIASTGVIGAPLAIDRLEAAAPALWEALRPDGIHAFSEAIVTTDTHPKVASRTGELFGKKVTVAGVAKGAGMIMPDMATMLGCIVTDAKVESDTLLELLRRAAWVSFNATTVDGDTSTNDTLYLLASGVTTRQEITSVDEPAFAILLKLVSEVCVELARMIAADGEGATKLVEVRVEEAFSEEEADVIGRRIANSPLVKTAWTAADANWGRIMGAIGVAGFQVDPSLVSLSIDGVDIVEGGVGLGADAEAEASVQMQKSQFTVLVKLGRGQATRSIYTCDLTAEYVQINADYRT